MKTFLEAEASKNWPRRLAARILFTLLVLCVLSLIFIFNRFDDAIEKVREAELDNLVWNVTQLDVEYQELQIAAKEYLLAEQSGPIPDKTGALNDLRLQFDLYYSRIYTFASTLRNMEAEDELSGKMGMILSTRDDLARQVERLQPGSREDAVAIVAAIDALAPTIREATVISLQEIAERSEAARLEERKLFDIYRYETLFLLALTVASAIIAFQLTFHVRRQNRELSRAQSFVTKAFEGALNAAIVVNQADRIILSNPAAEKIFGYDRGELDGRHLSVSILLGESYEKYRTVLRSVRDKGDVELSTNCVLRRKSGKTFHASIAVHSDKTVDGEVLNIIFITDISNRVAHEQRLRDAAAEARSLAEAKERFLSTMSHEMRTPLHGMMLALELIDDDRLDDETFELFRSVQLCSQRALDQVDFALNAIRGRNGKDGIVKFNPGDELLRIVAETTLLANRNGNVIHIAEEGIDENSVFYGHPKVFARVLYNLVGNAVKFTQNGEIRISLTCVPTGDEDQVELRVEVADTGPGISEESIKNIFEPFAKFGVESGGDVQSDGFGLGLSIARQEIESVNGRIDVESETGNGTRFFFSMPLSVHESAGRANPCPGGNASAPDAPAPLPEPASGTMLRALVVDDDRVNCALVAGILRKLGVSASTAGSGAEAIRIARVERFDIIFMDVRMPGIDGVAAARRIRSEGPNTGAPIIGITAQVDFDKSERYRQSDMSGVIIKPFGTGEMAGALNTFFPEIFDVAAARLRGDAGTDPTPVPPPRRESGLDRPSPAVSSHQDAAIRALLEDTITSCERLVQAVETRSQDRVASQDMAHKLSGAAGMLGFTRLGSLLLELEAELETGGDGAFLAVLPHLASEIARVRS